MNRPMHIAACSGGKDSVATILLAAQHGDPLDEVVFSEVMFDQNTTGEVPEHRDFIYDRLKPFCEKELGVKLFEKNGHKITLTQFGEEFLSYAEKTLDVLDRSEEHV